MTRVYIPKVGSKVKLRSWEDYRMIDQALINHDRSVQRAINEVSTALRTGELTEAQAKELEEKTIDELRLQHAEYEKTHDLPCMWAWFEVLAAGASTCRLRHTSRRLNAPEPAWEGDVRTECVEAPLGWKPIYEIVCKDKKQADKVINEWFKRGIHVWTSADLSSGGRKAFTPYDEGRATVDSVDSPHWQFTDKPTESIPPALCPSCFIVKVYEEWEPKLPPTEKLRNAEVTKLRESGATVEYSRREHMWVATRETTIYQPEEM